MKKTLLVLLLLSTLVGGFTLTLRTSKYLEDFDYMWEHLESNNVYLKTLEADGVDLTRVHDVYREAINEIKNDEEFILLLNDLMAFDLKGISHLGIIDANFYQYINNLMNCSEDMNFNRFDIIKERSVQRAYRQISDLKKHDYKCEVIPDEGVPITSSQNEDTLIIKVDTFDHLLKDMSLEYLDDVLEKSNYDNIIIDLRFNSGGSTLFADELMSRFLKEPLVWKENYQGYGEAAYTYYKDNEFTVSGDKDSYHVETVHEVKPHSKTYLNKEIYLLAEDNYSASHYFIENFSRLDNVSVYGRAYHVDQSPTIDPFMVKLPKTGFIFKYDPAIKISYYGKSSSSFMYNPENNVGTRDALSLVLDIINP